MTVIKLHAPVQAAEALRRVHLFPGRSMGEVEFDRRQAYADARLQPLSSLSRPGILRGLQVEAGSGDTPGTEAGDGVLVSPGLAVSGNGTVLGLYQPLGEDWGTLVSTFMDAHPGESSKGVYYLTLHRSSHVVDATQHIDACQRFDLDRLRDSRQVVVGALRLRKLAVTDDSILDRRRFENLVAAMHVDGEFLSAMRDAVPLGLVGVDGLRRVRWLSETAGRYLAEPNAGYRVLARHVRETLDEAIQRYAAGDRNPADTIVQHLERNVSIDFLPAAGELPAALLRDITEKAVNVGWLPIHLWLDMIPVPASAVAELVDRHIGRRPIDLRHSTAGEHVRLLLAVDDDSYAKDLLDIPAPEAALTGELFRNHMRAHNAWRRWREEFALLYRVQPDADLRTLKLAELDLPRPVDAPMQPQRFYERLIADAHAELSVPDGMQPPYPYRSIPEGPADYGEWLVRQGDRQVPPPPTLPDANGLVIQAALASEDLERLDNKIRAGRERLEKTRDYLLLQRQQLDSQTVSLASLAGGVAGDGSGLQVARTLPFSLLKAAAAEPQGDGQAASPTSRSAAVTQPPAVAMMDMTSVMPTALGVGATRTTYSSSSSVVFSMLKKTQLSSAFELTLNKTRLDKLAQTPKASIGAPAFDYKTQRFGVLEHIRPELSEYRVAYRGMQDLLSTLDSLFVATEAASLRKILGGFGTPTAPEDIETKHQDSERVSAQYEALFNAGKLLTKHIAFMETRHSRLEKEYEGLLRQRIRQEALLEKLSARIVATRDRLEALDARRVEALGDYGVTQRLVDEELGRVYAALQERSRILTDEVRGLYYTRTRSAPVSMALADPLELRFATSADAVPGCDWETDPDLPDELTEFFDAVLEVPVDNWAALRPLQVKLPPPRKAESAFAVRKERLRQRQQVRAADSSGKLAQRLFPLAVQSKALISGWATLALPKSDLAARAFADKTAAVLSLEDALTTGSGALRRGAEELRLSLEQAVACLLEKLNLLSPSIRLQWSELAEADRLAVDDVSRWPALDRAGREEFAAARTILELVAWWFRRLSDNASAEAIAALRNMIRATVIFAALGDPNEIVRGQVRTPPRKAAVGEVLKLDLDRTIQPGALLQLFDRQQRGIAVVRAEDQDASGTLASIVSVTKTNISITSEFTVIGGKAGRIAR